jgi:hypothetical protein
MATSFHDRKGGWPMPLTQHSRDDRQAVLAEVERLLGKYLRTRIEFERDLQVVLEGNRHSKAVNALMGAVNARKLAFGRYVAAAVETAQD